MNKPVDLLAINHWPVAIATHTANHPGARHMCARIEGLLPEELIPGGHLNILVASPECTHHSIARGGKPVSDQLRASAWNILRWVEALRIDNILLENVQEFRNWGPTGANGQPLKTRKGETYQAFLNALRSLGYTVEDRILNAADYGDATARKRLFVLARKGKKKIEWPRPSHGDPLFGLKPYRAAREIIDWNLKGESIFNRKKALAPATLARIAAGIKKFGGRNAGAFLVMLYGSNNTRSVDRPLPTVTANGQHIGLAEPFIVPVAKSVNQPLGTITTKARYCLCEPFVVVCKGSSKTSDCKKPLPTVTTKSDLALCEPFITILKGESKVRGCDKPLPTITTNPHLYLCEPFLTKYYGRGEGAKSVDEPLDTITTKDRFGLVEVTGKYQMDIRFRMLQPHELAAAMSFGDYKFTGGKVDQVKQIGNAVPVRMAEALCGSLLGAIS